MADCLLNDVTQHTVYTSGYTDCVMSQEQDRSLYACLHMISCWPSLARSDDTLVADVRNVQ